MWISKKAYERLVQENVILNDKVREQGLRISSLLRTIEELSTKPYAPNDKCYEVTVIARGSKEIQYIMSATSHDDAYAIATEQFEKDNLNYSKEDIEIVRTKEI